MVEGIINYLLSQSKESPRYLLDNFVIKIVPMINVDGVVHGNTRAELIGSDPNRKWSAPNQSYHSVIHTIKKMIEKDRDIVELVLDLHAHSRKFGTFFYGNQLPKNSFLSKIYPIMVGKSDERFDIRSNRFGGGSDDTARKVLYDITSLPLIYTVECSFYGYQKKNDFRVVPYSIKDYR